MQIRFVGAAQTVTGSKHVVRTARATVLLDCGLFQGRRRESNEKNRTIGIAEALDAVVLSHAHLDHSGALPVLVRQGYRGPIFTTPATRDLCAALLEDAALIQAADARYVNKLIDRDGADMEHVEPLFDEHDVLDVLRQMVTLPYGRTQDVAPGVSLTFFDAGHVLGSAVTALDVEERGRTERIVYTGDLGRTHMPILRDPEVPDGATALVMESTYGNRVHPPVEEMDDRLAGIVRRVVERKGKVIIPSFALERAQEIMLALHRLRDAGRIPKIPVYVDSPLTVKITDVFRLHPECFDEETRALVRGAHGPFQFEDLHYVSEVEESKAIDADEGPAVIIAGSGMCEGGRVLHHLKATVEDDRNAVVIVGFQAAHTLGRRITERRPRVRIFGVERALRAEVDVLDGFSAHADRNDLVAYAENVRKRGPLKHVALVHGELPSQERLRADLLERGFPHVVHPAPGDVLDL